MTVDRKEDDEEKEVFMPHIQNMDENEIEEQEKRKMLSYRFKLLKKLNEEFKEQMMAQQQPERPEISRKTPYVFDTAKLKNVKFVNKGEISNMNVAKHLGEAISKSGTKKPGGGAGKSGVGPLKRSDDDKGGKNSKKFSTDANFNKTGAKISLCNNLQFDNLKDRGAKWDELLPDSYQESLMAKKIPVFKTLFRHSKPTEGTSRCYHTDSTKRTEVEKKPDACSPEINEKTEIYPILFGNPKSGPAVTSDVNEDNLPASFDIAKAVPCAFTAASHKLEEERQKDLYYRYHNMTFADLHVYLSEQRTFAVDAANKKRTEEHKKEQEKLKECLKNRKEDV